MTPTPIFHNHDKEEAVAFIAAHPFAVLAVNGGNGPVAAMVPLVFDEAGQKLLGHVARANPFWSAAEQSQAHAVAVFRGADAYVSPSSYPSKQEHGKVVPTWNYMAVEIRGQIKIETEPEAIRPYLTALTAKMESHRALPWQISDAPDDYIAKLSRAIIGFSLEIKDITYVRKLSQNKSVADKQGVVDALKASEKYEERLIAQEMKEAN